MIPLHATEKPGGEALRRRLEDAVDALIALLDSLDAVTADLEPDEEGDEAECEQSEAAA